MARELGDKLGPRIARLVLSLIEDADFVTGQTITIDGGNAIRA